MELNFYHEAKVIWGNIAGNSKMKKSSFEFGAHKKLLKIFQAGDFYYFFFNVREGKFEYMSPELSDVLGYDPLAISAPEYLSKIHPDDQPYFLNFEYKLYSFFRGLPIDKIEKYKIRYDFRIKNSKGEYVRILHQMIIIDHDEQGSILYSLGVHTDITYLKNEGTPLLSFIGLEGEPSFVDVGNMQEPQPFSPKLTTRELDIVKHLAEGLTSAEIAFQLNISPATVKTHRKNILRKMDSNKTVDLIAKVIKEGWL